MKYNITKNDTLIQGNGNIRFWIKSVFEFALMAGLITVIMAYCIIIKGAMG